MDHATIVLDAGIFGIAAQHINRAAAKISVFGPIAKERAGIGLGNASSCGSAWSGRWSERNEHIALGAVVENNPQASDVYGPLLCGTTGIVLHC